MTLVGNAVRATGNYVADKIDASYEHALNPSKAYVWSFGDSAAPRWTEATWAYNGKTDWKWHAEANAESYTITKAAKYSGDIILRLGNTVFRVVPSAVVDGVVYGADIFLLNITRTVSWSVTGIAVKVSDFALYVWNTLPSLRSAADDAAAASHHTDAAASHHTDAAGSHHTDAAASHHTDAAASHHTDAAGSHHTDA